MQQKTLKEPCTKIVRDEIAELTRDANRQMEKIGDIGRKMAVEVFRAGAILARIRDLLKDHGGWCEYQGRQNWNRGTVAHYIRFYETAKNEDAVAGMTKAEAVESLFGIRNEGTSKKASKEPQPSSDADEQISPLPSNAIGDAHDHVGQAISALTLLTGERSIDKNEIKKLKATTERLLVIIKELEER